MPQLRSQRVKRTICLVPILDHLDQPNRSVPQVVTPSIIAPVQDEPLNPGPTVDPILDQPLSASQIGEAVGLWPVEAQDAYLRLALDLTCSGVPALEADQTAYSRVRATLPIQTRATT